MQNGPPDGSRMQRSWSGTNSTDTISLLPLIAAALHHLLPSSTQTRPKPHLLPKRCVLNVTNGNTVTAVCPQSTNHYDNLPSMQKARSEITAADELERYLKSSVVYVEDSISWWRDNQGTYPRLSQMAIDYLSIPGVSDFATLSTSHLPALSIPTSHRC